MAFRLLAYTPQGTLIDEMVDEAYFPTDRGPLGIFTDYDPMVAYLESGVIRYSVKGKNTYFTVFGGALWVEKDKTIVLSELMENAKDIDLARAKLAKENAENLIVHSSDKLVIQQGEKALIRANVRIKAKNIYGGFEK